PDQVKDEFKKVIDLVLYVFGALGFEDYTAQVSLRVPENRSTYIGSDETWALAETAIIEAAEEKGLKTVVEYGEAAFYGPKLDFMVKDALGRKWQLGTIQVDYNLPERFELEYTGSDNQKHRPVMIHRAPFGSLERFVAVLIEHCGGQFPLWLAPEQFIILPVSEKYEEYAQKLLESLNNSDIRGLIDLRDEKVGRKIRDAEVKKIPYMLIVGEKEVESGTVSVRKHGSVDLGTMTSDEFRDLLIKEITVETLKRLALKRHSGPRPPMRKKEPELRINEHIRVPEVRLVGDNVEQGVYPARTAVEIADELELDLVEISPNAVPPVC